MLLEEPGLMVGVGLMAQAGTNDGHCLVDSPPHAFSPPIRKDCGNSDSAHHNHVYMQSGLPNLIGTFPIACMFDFMAIRSEHDTASHLLWQLLVNCKLT